MINVKNTQYIQTPFGGHGISSFIIKDQNKKGKEYYKLNTSILTDAKYKKLVQETIEELEHLAIQDEIEQWQTLLLTIRSKSICYSQKKLNKERTKRKHHKKNIRYRRKEPACGK